MRETGDDKADFARMEKALGGKLLLDMGTKALADSVAPMTTQAALMGRITATPAEPKKRQNVKTSKRRAGS